MREREEIHFHNWRVQGLFVGRKGCVVRTKVSGITTDLSGAGSRLVDRRGIRNSDPLEPPVGAKEATALSKTMQRPVSICGDSFWGDYVLRNKFHRMGRGKKSNGPVYQHNSISLLRNIEVPSAWLCKTTSAKSWIDKEMDKEILFFYANQNIQSAQSLISVGKARGPLQHKVFNQNLHCFLSCSTPQSLAFSYRSSPPGYKAGL